MAKKDSKEQKNKGGSISRSALYAFASKYSKDAIETLYWLMKNASQDSVKMGAANALLSKALPDLKAVELTGDTEKPLVFRIIEERNLNAESEQSGSN